MNDQEVILTAIGSLHDKIDKKSEDTHKRIDKLVGSVGEVQVTVGAMTVTMKDIKKDVNGHLEDHKQERAEVTKERRQAGWGILEKVIAAVLILCVSFLAYKMGWR